MICYATIALAPKDQCFNAPWRHWEEIHHHQDGYDDRVQALFALASPLMPHVWPFISQFEKLNLITVAGLTIVKVNSCLSSDIAAQNKGTC